MKRFFYANEIVKPADVIPYLAKQERHWKKGYSAYELAHSWIRAEGIPDPVRSVLDACPEYVGAALVEGPLERDVDLRTPGGRSQTDLLAIVKPVGRRGGRASAWATVNDATAAIVRVDARVADHSGLRLGAVSCGYYGPSAKELEVILGAMRIRGARWGNKT